MGPLWGFSVLGLFQFFAENSKKQEKAKNRKGTKRPHGGPGPMERKRPKTSKNMETIEFFAFSFGPHGARAAMGPLWGFSVLGLFQFFAENSKKQEKAKNRKGTKRPHGGPGPMERKRPKTSKNI